MKKEEFFFFIFALVLLCDVVNSQADEVLPIQRRTYKLSERNVIPNSECDSLTECTECTANKACNWLSAIGKNKEDRDEQWVFSQHSNTHRCVEKKNLELSLGSLYMHKMTDIYPLWMNLKNFENFREDLNWVTEKRSGLDQSAYVFENEQGTITRYPYTADHFDTRTRNFVSDGAFLPAAPIFIPRQSILDILRNTNKEPHESWRKPLQLTIVGKRSSWRKSKSMTKLGEAVKWLEPNSVEIAARCDDTRDTEREFRSLLLARASSASSDYDDVEVQSCYANQLKKVIEAQNKFVIAKKGYGFSKDASNYEIELLNHYWDIAQTELLARQTKCRELASRKAY